MQLVVFTNPQTDSESCRGGRALEEELTGSSPFRLNLRALPGCDAVHLRCADPRAPDCRFEIPVDGPESIEVHIHTEDTIRVSCPGRTVLRLPPDAKFEPAPPIPPPGAPECLDLAILIDGTTRFELSDLLLDKQEPWGELSISIGLLVSALAEKCSEIRIALLAFGDQPMDRQDLPADDLEPRYHLLPTRAEDRRFQHLSPEDLVEHLQALPASSGGDFVDALADGLHAASKLHWRASARKLLLVVGDSPGPSLEHPLFAGGDICVRDRDVDIEAMHLHRLGIEIATLYVDPSWEKLGLDQLPANQLLKDTERQYRRLASLPEMAFIASAFQLDHAAEHLLTRPTLIARGPSHGILLDPVENGSSEAIPESEAAPPPREESAASEPMSAVR